MQRRILFGWICLLGAWIASASLCHAAGADGGDDVPIARPDAASRQGNLSIQQQIIRAAGIRPTKESILKYFADYDAQLRRAHELVPQLGDENFGVRRQATEAFLKMPTVPRQVLEAALQHKDPEIRWRAQSILKTTSDKPGHGPLPSRHVCKAILALVAAQRVPDCQDVVLQVADHYPDFEVLYLGSRAFQATLGRPAAVPPEDATSLSKILGGESAARQALALPAAFAADPPAADRAAGQLLTTGQGDAAHLLVAFSVLNRGDVAALPHVVRCLQPSASSEVRSYALQILRKVCNRPHADANAEEWSAWLAARGKTLTLNTPVVLVLNSFETFLTRVQLYSAGFTKGNGCGIKLDGKLLIGGKGDVQDRRGINLLAVHDDQVLVMGSYDVFSTEEASNLLAADIAKLPHGCMVILVAADEPSMHWNDNAQKALESIGGSTSLTGKYRHAYYCIGYKGLAKGKAVERLDATQGPIYYPDAAAGQFEIHDYGPDEYRKEPRIRITNGVRREVLF